MIIPINPEKPALTPSYNIKDSKHREFIKFMVDLKVQEALARNEGDNEYADEIRAWFESFEKLLNELLGGENIYLKFNIRTYAFTISQDQKEFGFNELSDGYSAIIDIVADLILKMQDPENVTRAYQKQGIVLIDEIETHLHLELQKAIMPMLTRIFPNIQFIITTHSPFILNSTPNAVAYDLEKQEKVENLNEYSYDTLAEGYFDVSIENGFLNAKLKRFEQLIKKQKLDSEQQEELNKLQLEFDNAMDSLLVPDSVKIEYRKIKLNS